MMELMEQWSILKRTRPSILPSAERHGKAPQRSYEGVKEAQRDSKGRGVSVDIPTR